MWLKPSPSSPIRFCAGISRSSKNNSLVSWFTFSMNLCIQNYSSFVRLICDLFILLFVRITAVRTNIALLRSPFLEEELVLWSNLSFGMIKLFGFELEFPSFTGRIPEEGSTWEVQVDSNFGIARAFDSWSFLPLWNKCSRI